MAIQTLKFVFLKGTTTKKKSNYNKACILAVPQNTISFFFQEQLQLPCFHFQLKIINSVKRSNRYGPTEAKEK